MIEMMDTDTYYGFLQSAHEHIVVQYLCSIRALSADIKESALRELVKYEDFIDMYDIIYMGEPRSFCCIYVEVQIDKVKKIMKHPRNRMPYSLDALPTGLLPICTVEYIDQTVTRIKTFVPVLSSPLRRKE